MQVREWTIQTNPIYRKHLSILLPSNNSANLPLSISHTNTPSFISQDSNIYNTQKRKKALPSTIKMNPYNSKSKIHNLTRQRSNTTHTPLIISQTSCKHYNPNPILNQFSLKLPENTSHTNSLQAYPSNQFQPINTPWRFLPFSYFLDQNRWETKNTPSFWNRFFLNLYIDLVFLLF